MLLQTQSLAYIDASTAVVLSQAAILFVAVFDALIFGNYPTAALALITLLQGAFVSLFNLLGQPEATAGGRASEGEAYALGIVMCGLSAVCSALGSILQQHFLQRKAPDMPLDAKLFYQHIIGFLVMVTALLSKPDARARLLQQGFFDGWNEWTYICSAGMWVYFWTASAVTAQISAMAGAMGAAVAIVLTGVGESLVFGKSLAGPQRVLMAAICCNALLYAAFKKRAREAAEAADAAKRK